MHAASAFLAMALLGGDPAPRTPEAKRPDLAPVAHPGIEGRMTICESGVGRPDIAGSGVRFDILLLNMKGLDWRGAHHESLVPASRQGTATVWTARRALVGALRKAADATNAPPSVCSPEGAPIEIVDGSARKIVGDVHRVADGPPGQNSVVAFEPEIQEFRDTFEGRFAARKVEQGMMVEAEITDARVTAVHNYAIQDGATDPKTKAFTAIVAQAQVPEVVTNEAGGEWLVPTDHVLIVSLGAYTTSDPNGRAEVRERLVVIDTQAARGEPALTPAQAFGAMRPPASPTRHPSAPPLPIGPSMLLPLASPSVTPTRPPAPPARDGAVTVVAFPIPASPFPVVGLSRATEPAPVANAEAKPIPPMPSRHLPIGVGSDGTIVPLPPLPDEDVVPAATSPEPLPSPQQNRPTTPRPQASAPRRATPEGTFRLAGHTTVATIRDAFATDEEAVCDEMILFPAPRLLPAETTSDAASLPACPARADDRVSPPTLGRHTAEEDWAIAPTSLTVDGTVLRSLLRDDAAPPRMVRCATCRKLEGVDFDFVLDDGQEDRDSDGPSLGLQLRTAQGASRYDGDVSLKALGDEPMLMRVPMGDGSIVEVQVKLVKKAEGK